MSRDDAYLFDILDSARTALEYMRGKNWDDFKKEPDAFASGSFRLWSQGTKCPEGVCSHIYGGEPPDSKIISPEQ